MLVSILKKNLNKVESSFPEILLFYYTLNKRCYDKVVKIEVDCINIKHFNVEFVHTVPCQVAKFYFDIFFRHFITIRVY